MQQPTSVNPDEIEKFSRMAAEWWDPQGKFRPLHMINAVRLNYLLNHIAATFHRNRSDAQYLKGLKILDVGCGGGLLSEPFARLGAEVTGIDASARNIEIAKLHAAQSGLTIDYRATTLEELTTAKEVPQYDIVLALEIIEHVADQAFFTKLCAQMLSSEGLLFMSTINRTLAAYVLAILGAEYILRWLPRGTHEWKSFVTPAELYRLLGQNGIRIKEMKGLTYHPLSCEWKVSSSLDVNYLVTASREK